MRHKNTSFRRTTSRVLNAIFNILGPYIKEASFLDLYAGVGTVGIEALLRGATEVVFVEADRKRADQIKKALEQRSLIHRARVVNKKVETFLRIYKEKGFDIIFLDPPYHNFNPNEILNLVAEKLTKNDTLIILEHFHKVSPPEQAGRHKLHRQYRYGDTVLSVYSVT